MGKWISVGNACVPTYGKHGEEFELTLKYHEYYGHISERRTEVVTAIWDSLNERFVEKRTGKEIAAEDIAEWYMEGEAKLQKRTHKPLVAPDSSERCVCCGDVIPEGRQVCPKCEKGT